MPQNMLIVATASKLARIAWAVLSSGENYRAAIDRVGGLEELIDGHPPGLLGDS